MRLKSVVKYNISEMKNSVLIFYGIMAAISVLLVTSFTSTSFSVDGSVNGTEMASIIFLFVVGLNSFKNNYLFLSTNGITRKAQFYGFIISAITIVIVMVSIDIAYSNILNGIIGFSPLFSQGYKGWAQDVSKPIYILMGFAWSVAIYLFVILLGYFITTLYYRMSKMLKIIVSIGVPVLFTMVIPAIDLGVNNGRLVEWSVKVFIMLAGNGSNPFTAVISLLIGAAILAGLTYLLVRKAPLKA